MECSEQLWLGTPQTPLNLLYRGLGRSPGGNSSPLTTHHSLLTQVHKAACETPSSSARMEPFERDNFMNNVQQSNVVVSERHQKPGVIMASQPKGESFGWAAVLAAIATLLFIVLVAMQWMDLQALKIA